MPQLRRDVPDPTGLVAPLLGNLGHSGSNVAGPFRLSKLPPNLGSLAAFRFEPRGGYLKCPLLFDE